VSISGKPIVSTYKLDFLVAYDAIMFGGFANNLDRLPDQTMISVYPHLSGKVQNFE
jgi:hypothetical protein